MRRPQPVIGWVLTIAGAIGFLAAFTLLVEKVRLLTEPDYVPSCSINPVLSCGSVMTTPQAEVFGFPNPILGVAGFAVVTTVGMALVAGAVLPAWFWAGLTAGAVAGVVLVHWLAYQSLYVIGALCPYCMVVWVVTMTTFAAVAAYWARAGALPRWLHTYAPTMVVAWVLLVAALIAARFWDYWSSVLV